MITIRRSADRFHAERDWLTSRFTFSFGPFQDPAHNGFRALKVMNEDRVSPGKGFGPHSHRDMEIITYVLEGRLAHRDSMGERHTLGANEIQAMSAGDGIVHSEFNGSDTEPAHSIQIWIEPRAEDLTPSYRQFAFEPAEKRGRLRLLARPTRRLRTAWPRSTRTRGSTSPSWARASRSRTSWPRGATRGRRWSAVASL